MTARGREPAEMPMLHCGSVTVMLPGDGRALLWVKTERGPAWLELGPEERAWLGERLLTAEGGTDGSGGGV